MATATGTTVLKTAIATYPHTKALKDGTVTAPGLQFEHLEVSPIVRGLPPHVPRPGIRRLRDGDHHLSDGQGLSQTLHGPAGLCLAPVPPLPHRLSRQVWGDVAQGSGGEESRRAGLHRDHRCLGQGHPGHGVRRRPQQGDLGAE